jgi:putative endonuclease
MPPPSQKLRILAGSEENKPLVWHVYVLRDSKGGKLYVGLTGDLDRRLVEHRSGQTQTTSSFTKPELVYFEGCLNKKDAARRELQLKTGFGRGYLTRRLQDYLVDK